MWESMEIIAVNLERVLNELWWMSRCRSGSPRMDGCNVFFFFFSFLLPSARKEASRKFTGKKTLNVYVVMNLTVRGKIRDQQSQMQSIISTYKDSESKIAQLIIWSKVLEGATEASVEGRCESDATHPGARLGGYRIIWYRKNFSQNHTFAGAPAAAPASGWVLSAQLQ